jgi:hypothetical protein
MLIFLQGQHNCWDDFLNTINAGCHNHFRDVVNVAEIQVAFLGYNSV